MAYNNQNNQGNRRPSYTPEIKWKEIPIRFQEATYVDEAEMVIKELEAKNFSVKRTPRDRNGDELTTSQIRNLLSLTSTLYDEVQTKPMSDVMDRIAYLRVQFIYQSGRNAAVKKLVELADILNILKSIQEKQEKERLIRFCHYMEALVAYFKYYGGKD